MEEAYVTTLDNHDDIRLPIDSSASLRSDCRWQLSCGLGGNFPVDWVATFLWIGWQNSVEYAGINAFLLKPIGLQNLAATIQEVLKVRRN